MKKSKRCNWKLVAVMIAAVVFICTAVYAFYAVDKKDYIVIIHFALDMILIMSFCFIIYNYFKTVEKYEKRVSRLRHLVNDRGTEIEAARAEIKTLERKNDKLSDWERAAVSVDPDIADKVSSFLSFKKVRISR